MKPTTVRALAAMTVGLLLASVALAQPGRGRARGFSGGDGPGHRGGGDRLVKFLELTEDQQAQWKAAHEDHAAANQALHDQRRDNRAELQGALESSDPDPTTVGELFLAGRDLQSQLKDSREQLEETLKSFLTDEQIERWEAFEAARGQRGRDTRGGKMRRHRGRDAGSGEAGSAIL